MLFSPSQIKIITLASDLSLFQFINFPQNKKSSIMFGGKKQQAPVLSNAQMQ